MTSPTDSKDLPEHIYRGVLIAIQTVMAAELAWMLYTEQWSHAFPVIVIMLLTLSPLVLSSKFETQIPPEFQILALVFLFATLFLGEIQSYYERIWWWDMALHTTAGLLMGILGFLLVYVINEDKRVNLHMRPSFVAMFAFLFAVSVGSFWEIFEFSMDQLTGSTMQKPMFDDPSGLTDTMWDIIVNALGAIVISTMGWWYMHNDEPSFVQRWIQKFIERNPHLFRS